MTEPDEECQNRVARARAWVEGPGNPHEDDLAALVTPPVDDPIATVITPCHDDGAFLLDAMASVRLCREDRLAMVIVDDHSTDPQTVEILERIASAGANVLSSNGSGPSSARNVALSSVDTDLVVALDADNLLRPGYVSAARDRFDARPDLASVHADAMRFGSDVGRWNMVIPEVADLLCGNKLDTCSVLRRSALEQVGGWDPHVLGSEDWALWVALLAAGWHLESIPMIGFDYRVRDGSLNSTLTPSRLVEHLGYLVHTYPAIYTEHLDAVIANFAGALAQRTPDLSSLAPVDASERRLVDHVRALQAELAACQNAAREARRQLATLAVDRRADQENFDELARRLDERKEELARVNARLAATEEHVRAYEQTRLFRLARQPRNWYARLRGARRG